jgi:catechol 2,3-dioxygenase-like lactoylglutathione lyase family enzyme
VALAVRDLERSVAFYRAFLGRGPSKRRPGWARFETESPSMNLTLSQLGGDVARLDAVARPHAVAHLGVQVQDAATVRREAGRLGREGLETDVERDVTCCHAVQDKVWVTDPDGHRWEVYVVLDDDAPCCDGAPDDCCATAHAARSCCAGPAP